MKRLGSGQSMGWWIGLLVLVVLLLPRWALAWRFGTEIADSPEAAPYQPVAIVFGAGLRRDGSPTLVLADRVATAAALYHQGKVGRLLLSGSAHGDRYDEPAAMRSLALRLGIPDAHLTLDRQGLRTRLTCQRAAEVFGIKHALLVTQRFHLPRALALCQASGIQAAGVAADLHAYAGRSRRFWELREYPACLAALIETWLPRSDLASRLPGDPHGT